jgi:hypothetical protein
VPSLHLPTLFVFENQGGFQNPADRPVIGYSRALMPRAEPLTGRISFFPASSGLPQYVQEFRSISIGTRSAPMPNSGIC